MRKEGDEAVLIRYELRKLLSGRMKWLLLLMFAANFVIYYLYLIPVSPVKEEQELYEQMVNRTGDRSALERELGAVEAQIDVLEEEALRRLESGETDYVPSEEEEIRSNVVYKLQEEYREVLGFYSFVDDVEDRSRNLLSFSIFSKEGSFSKRNIEKTAEDFAGMRGVEAEPQDGAGLERMQNFPLTDVLLLVAVGMLSFQIFGTEGRSGMQKLLNTTVRGGKKLRLVKVSTVSICIILYVLALYGSNMWQTGTFVGLPDAGAEIHGIMEFRNIPFPCKAGEYLLLTLLWKAAAACAAGMLFQAVIYRMNGAKAAWIILGAGTALSFLCWFYLPANPVMKTFRYLNLIGIFDTGEIIGNYQNLNLFTYPVQLRIAAVVLAVLVFILCAGMTVLLPPSEFRMPERRRKRTVRRKSRDSIFFYECYKNLSKQKAWLVFAVLLFYAVYTGINTAGETEYLSKQDYGYEQLAKQFIGQRGSELEKSMEELAGRQDFTSSEEAMAVQRVLAQGADVLENGGEEARFVSERSWGKVFFDQDVELANLLLYVLCIAFSVSGMFQFEIRSRMKRLIHPTVKNGRVFWSKLGVACMEAALYGAVLWAGTYISLLIKYKDLEGLAWPACSLPEFRDFPAWITIAGALAIVFIQRIISAVLTGVILFLAAQIVTVPAYFIAVAAVGFLLPSAVLLIANMDYINPLIILLQGSVEPFLRYIYIFSSWFSVRQQYPMLLYPALCAGAVLLVWAGSVRWKESGA